MHSLFENWTYLCIINLLPSFGRMNRTLHPFRSSFFKTQTPLLTNITLFFLTFHCLNKGDKGKERERERKQRKRERMEKKGPAQSTSRQFLADEDVNESRAGKRRFRELCPAQSRCCPCPVLYSHFKLQGRNPGGKTAFAGSSQRSRTFLRSQTSVTILGTWPQLLKTRRRETIQR